MATTIPWNEIEEKYAALNVMFLLMRLKDIMPAQEGISKRCWQIRSTGSEKTECTARKTGY